MMARKSCSMTLKNPFLPELSQKKLSWKGPKSIIESNYVSVDVLSCRGCSDFSLKVSLEVSLVEMEFLSLPCVGNEALAQISHPGNVQGQVGQALEQPGIVGGSQDPAWPQPCSVQPWAGQCPSPIPRETWGCSCPGSPLLCPAPELSPEPLACLSPGTCQPCCALAPCAHGKP